MEIQASAHSTGERALPVFTVRRETGADHDEIRRLTARAFAGHAYSDGSEPRIIDALREARALVLSLVAVAGGRVVGHAGFSPAGPPDLQGWFVLAPVSVEPSLQRQGAGTLLVRTGLDLLRERGGRGCVVLGDHRYYARFGFLPAPHLAPPGWPAEHFQVLAFGASLPTARVVFHPAFPTGK